MGIVYKNGRCEVCLPFEYLHTVEKIYKYVTDMEVNDLISCHTMYLFQISLL